MTKKTEDNYHKSLLTSNRSEKAGGVINNDKVDDKEKITGAAPFFFVFKSCVGLGVFSYPFAMGKVGAIWGSILSVIICYMSTYGMYSLTRVAVDVDHRLKGMKEMTDMNGMTI
jgi:Transmembrane amino acid transporter protein